MEFRHRSDPRRLVDKRPKISRALPVRPCSAQRSLSRRRNELCVSSNRVCDAESTNSDTHRAKAWRSVAESAPEATAWASSLHSHGLMRIPWDPISPKTCPEWGRAKFEASHLANSATGKYRDLLPGTIHPSIPVLPASRPNRGPLPPG